MPLFFGFVYQHFSVQILRTEFETQNTKWTKSCLIRTPKYGVTLKNVPFFRWFTFLNIHIFRKCKFWTFQTSLERSMKHRTCAEVLIIINTFRCLHSILNCFSFLLLMWWEDNNIRQCTFIGSNSSVDVTTYKSIKLHIDLLCTTYLWFHQQAYTIWVWVNDMRSNTMAQIEFILGWKSLRRKRLKTIEMVLINS